MRARTHTHTHTCTHILMNVWHTHTHAYMSCIPSVCTYTHTWYIHTYIHVMHTFCFWMIASKKTQLSCMHVCIEIVRAETESALPRRTHACIHVMHTLYMYIHTCIHVMHTFCFWMIASKVLFVACAYSSASLSFCDADHGRSVTVHGTYTHT